jgi:hypothetical protein
MAADQTGGDDFFTQFGGQYSGAPAPGAPAGGGIGGGPAPAGATPGGTTPPTTPPAQDFGNLQDPAQWMALVSNPQKLDAWIASQAPWMPPDLRQYYAGVITKQPGANANEQAGSASYYLNEFNADPKNPKGTNVGNVGGGMPGGSMATPYGEKFGAPSMEDLENQPGWQFALQEGIKGLDRSAAAKGTVLNGGEKQDILKYATGLLSQTAQQGYENSLNTYLTNYNVWRGDNNDIWGRYRDLSTAGTNAAGAATS